MSASSVPTIVFGQNGLVLPAESSILAGVQADMNAAFGGNLNPALSTPQGQLATSEAAIIADKNAMFAKFVSQVDPDTADGFMQDAIGRIYFLDRRPATPTTVQVDCNGLNGVVIPVGAQVIDVDGNIYSCTLGGVIPASGTVTLPFASNVLGPISCPIGSISGAPYRAILGWDRAYNSQAGIPGTLVETRFEFENRRRQSVAINGKGTLPSIYANVFNVPGVIDVYAYENTKDSSITVGSTNFTLVPHSVYIAVVGGSGDAIAKAIWQKKDAGADYNGNTAVAVVDDSGYSYPQPSYQVKFHVPASRPVKFNVQLASNDALPSDIVARVKAAIIASFTGADGGQRARIGATIFASRFYSGISAIAPTVSILSLMIGTTTANSPSLLVGIDQAPTVSESDISVTLA